MRNKRCLEKNINRRWLVRNIKIVVDWGNIKRQLWSGGIWEICLLLMIIKKNIRCLRRYKNCRLFSKLVLVLFWTRMDKIQSNLIWSEQKMCSIIFCFHENSSVNLYPKLWTVILINDGHEWKFLSL